MKQILFVDDEIKILDGIRRMLYADRKRWEMQFVLGGDAALQACEETRFDVVITDMRMPGMDGATLLGLIRDRNPEAARIILSGYSEIASARRAVSVAHRFLSKPCSAFELQSTIEQVCALQEILNKPELRRVVGSVGELPSLSTTYTYLTDAVCDPDSTISTVAEIIEEDVAMSAKVLQLVNSAFFGLAQKVTSLSTAVSYLGMDTIKNLALASEAFRVLEPDSRISPEVCESMERHAHLASGIAGVLPMDAKIREIAVVAALLHDVGRLFLASTMPEEFCQIFEIGRERNCRLFEAEIEVLGTSHAEIGAYLLGLWGIPNLAVEAICHHHEPTRIPHISFDCSVAVYVADLLAQERELHPKGLKDVKLEESDRACLETLGLLPQYAEFRELAQQIAY